MPANRCSICNLDFPRVKMFETCPICEEPTSPFGNIEAMDGDEAEKLKLHADFERQYGPADVKQYEQHLLREETDAGEAA